MEIDIQALPIKERYKLMTGLIVPRPIAWVSTINTEGLPNLAPYSFFSGITTNPPSLLFVPGVRAINSGLKDTLVNVQETGEFVVNIVNETLLEQMNITATELPPEINEFEEAGLTPAPSLKVKAPRVKESPVNFECKVMQIVPIGDGDVGSAWIVIGEILHIHVHEGIINNKNHVDTKKLSPVARLAGPNYATLSEMIEVIRQPSKIKKE